MSWAWGLCISFATILSVARCGAAEDSWIGVEVMPKRASLLQVDGHTIDDVARNRLPYTVRDAKDGLLLVGDRIQGWVPAAEVVRLKEASDFYSRLVKSDPENWWAYYCRATVLMRGRFYDVSIKDLTTALKLEPKSAVLLNARGTAWYYKGDLKNAFTDFEEAIRLQPDDPQAYNNRGLAWERMGQSKKAFADYSRAIELDPDYSSPYNNRGMLWTRVGQFDKAGEDFDRVIALNPSASLPYHNRAYLRATQGEFVRAIADYDEAIRLNPKYSVSWAGRAGCWLQLGEFNKAIDDYTGAIRNGAGQTIIFEYYIGRGRARLAKDEFDEAIADFTRATGPNLPVDGYIARSEAWRQQGNYEKAIADLEQALKLDPESFQAHTMLAWTLVVSAERKNRDGERALKLAQKARDMTNGRNSEALATLAAAFAETGDFPSASKSLSEAIELERSEPVRRQWQGRLQRYKEGKPYREGARERPAAVTACR